MRMVVRLFVLLLVGLLGACTSVREYPRCYLFRAPSAQDIEAVNRDTEKLLRDAMRFDEFSIGKDAIVVNTLEEHHRKLAGVWSANGCINLRRPPPETGEINDKWIVSRCQDYMDEMIRRYEAEPRIAKTTIADKYRDFTCH